MSVLVVGRHAGPVVVVVTVGRGHVRSSRGGGRHDSTTVGTSAGDIPTMGLSIGRVRSIGRNRVIGPLGVHGWSHGSGRGHLVGTRLSTTTSRSNHSGDRLLSARGRGRTRQNEGVGSTSRRGNHGLLREARGDRQRSTVVARQRVAAVLDALALNAKSGVAELLAVE